MSGESDNPKAFKSLHEWIVPTLAVSYAVYFLIDVYGGPEESVLLGALLSAFVFVLAFAVVILLFTKEKPNVPAARAWSWRTTTMVLGMAVYIGVIHYFGFVAAALAFFFPVLFILGTRSWLKLTVLSITLTGLGYFIFIYLLDVSLAEGVIF